MGRLDGKVAIVSGGGTGIGAATARLFAAEGAKVVVTGRRPEPIETVAAEVGGQAVAGDTSDEEHVRTAVAAAREAYGGLTSWWRTRPRASVERSPMSTTISGIERST
jgi:meso-butanediol dehydrogenase / (S,S)-butanediol dehydrogenase / diacetyl reductase